jgi:hypothetical protein
MIPHDIKPKIYQTKKTRALYHARSLSYFAREVRTFGKKRVNLWRPLYLLKGGAKMLEWSVSAQKAFQNAKRLLVAAVPLQHPNPNAELSFATDASDTHIVGVMQQKSGDHWRPLGFFSRKLTDKESRYLTFDRKLLAAHAAIKHFRHFCEGRAFQSLDRT